MSDNISCEEFKQNKSKYHIIDVRESDEYSAGHIEGAVNIPLGKLMRDEKNGIVPKDKEVVVHCKSGGRGSVACQFLKQKGYNVRNLEGGYDSYCA